MGCFRNTVLLLALLPVICCFAFADKEGITYNQATYKIRNAYTPTGFFSLDLLNENAHTYAVVLNYEGSLDVTAIQFVLSFPIDFPVYGNKLKLCGNNEGDYLVVRQLYNNKFLIIVSNRNNNLIGKRLLYIPIEPSYGEFDLNLSDIHVSNTECVSSILGEETLKTVWAPPVSIVANSYSREYGDANPTFEYTTEGASLDGVPEIICEATETSSVGTYDIVVKRGSVANYNVSYVAGTLSVTKAPILVTVGNYCREYGQENPTFELVYEGLKNDEDCSVFLQEPIATTTATKNSPVGEYVIKVGGGIAQNYSFEYVDGVLTITMATGFEKLLTNEKAFTVYNICGVRHPVSSLNSLPRGVYFVRQTDGRPGLEREKRIIIK